MMIVAIICELVMLVCWIMVIVKMFQTAGAVQGILGIVCSLWAFIWGWMNSDKVGKNIMLAWTAALIVMMIVGAMGGLNFNFKVGNVE